MSNKRKRTKIDEERARRREASERERMQRLREQGRVVYGEVVPEDAIPADPDQQAPNNSYSPPLFYRDQPFVCCDCGAEEVWTAEQQKWYFEVIKAPIYARAVRCRECRRKRRERRQQQSGPGEQ